jgi:hypothetical protein
MFPGSFAGVERSKSQLFFPKYALVLPVRCASTKAFKSSQDELDGVNTGHPVAV